MPPTDIAHAPTVEDVLQLVERGERTWAESCEQPNAHGLCLESVTVQDGAHDCYAPLLGRVVVHPRNPAEVERAQADFVEARRLAKRVANRDPDVQAKLNAAVATANLRLADAELEAYLAHELPEGLRFLVDDWKKDSGLPQWEAEHAEQVVARERSQGLFRDYWNDKTASRKHLEGELEAVMAQADSETEVAALLRTTWAATHFYDQAMSIDVPAKVDRARYCNELTRLLDNHRKRSLDTATQCTRRASKAGRDEVAKTCRSLAGELSTPRHMSAPPAEVEGIHSEEIWENPAFGGIIGVVR